MIRNRRKQRNEDIEINAITKETWETHFKALYESQAANNDERTHNNMSTEENTSITVREVIATTKLKNKKSPEPDSITNEMINTEDKQWQRK